MGPQNRFILDPSTHPGIGAIPYGGAGCQVWKYDESIWGMSGIVRPDLSSASVGTIKWTFSLYSLGMSVGDTLKFDIATTGAASSDPGIDHLSRSDLSTDGWATPSVAGDFLEYELSGISGSQTFQDTVGDVFDFDNLDIRWAVIGHDAQNLYITVNVNDNLLNTDWTNFVFMLDTDGKGASTNAWGRPIDLGGQVIDVFLGSWINNADSGVSFRTWAPNADAVALVGDFNNWSLFSTMLVDEGLSLIHI